MHSGHETKRCLTERWPNTALQPPNGAPRFQLTEGKSTRRSRLSAKDVVRESEGALT
jgi:hypothetical protein